MTLSLVSKCPHCGAGHHDEPNRRHLTMRVGESRVVCVELEVPNRGEVFAWPDYAESLDLVLDAITRRAKKTTETLSGVPVEVVRVS